MSITSFARRLAPALAVLLVLGPAAPDDASGADKKPLTERLLDIMLEKNVIDGAQYEELLEQARSEEAARAVPAVSAAEPGKPEWDFGWKNSFYLKRSDGAFNLKFGGRIENDWAVVNESENLSQQIGGVGTGTEFRRARFFFEGSVYEHGIFKAQYDFAGGEVEFKDVWAGLHEIPWIDRIRIGHMKEPFSLEQMTSDKYLSFMERALPDALVPARNTGLMIDRTFLDDRIYLGVGGFAITPDNGDVFENDSNYNLTARLTGLPIYADEGAQLLHVGVNYSHGFSGDGTVRYRQRPESHLAPVIVDTGNIPGFAGNDLVGGEIAGVFGPFNFQSEVIASFLSRREDFGNPAFWGGYGQVSWFLTGETRRYDPRDAVFARTSPKHNFSVKDGTFGAWEVAVRYSYLSLSRGGVQGGIVDDITAALNWYLFPNLRLMFNYVYSSRHGVGNASIAQSRVQIDF